MLLKNLLKNIFLIKLIKNQIYNIFDISHYLVGASFLSATESSTIVNEVPGRPTWQQTMLRIADPEKSLHFYCDIMGMTLIDTLDFPQWNFKLFFVATLPGNF